MEARYHVVAAASQQADVAPGGTSRHLLEPGRAGGVRAWQQEVDRP